MINSMIHKYAMDASDTSALNTALWSLSQDDLLDAQAYYSTPIDSILGFKWYPLSKSNIGGVATRKIYLAQVDTGVTANVVQASILTISAGTFNITRKYSDYRDYLTKLSAYIPFVGIVPLDTYLYMGKQLRVVYYVDLDNGNGICQLHRVDGNDDIVTDILQFEMGYDVPISSFATPSVQLRNNFELSQYGGLATKAIGGAVAGGKFGGLPGAILGGGGALIQGGFSAHQAIENYRLTEKAEFNHTSSFGPGFQQLSGITLYIFYTYPHIELVGGTLSNKTALIGLPTGGVVDQLGNFSGFISGTPTSPVFETNGLAGITQEEKDMIYSAIQSGVYNNASSTSDTMYSLYVAPYL